MRFAAAEALMGERLLRKASAARAMQDHPPSIGKDPGADSEVPLPPCAACAAAEAPCPACAMGNTILASAVEGNRIEPDLSGSLCDLGNDEGFPVIRIGDFRPAVSAAQLDLNYFLAHEFERCKLDQACSSIYQPERWTKMMYHYRQIKQLPLAVDCIFGPDTWHATLIAQVFFFKPSQWWDGVIGCQTWRAIDPRAPSCESASPPEPVAPGPFELLPPWPAPPKPIFL
jgi:hypothetical protein